MPTTFHSPAFVCDQETSLFFPYQLCPAFFFYCAQEQEAKQKELLSRKLKVSPRFSFSFCFFSALSNRQQKQISRLGKKWCCDVIELIAFCLYFFFSSFFSLNFFFPRPRRVKRNLCEWREIPFTAQKCNYSESFSVDSSVICYVSLKLKGTRFTRNLKRHFYWTGEQLSEIYCNALCVLHNSFLVARIVHCRWAISTPIVCWRWQNCVAQLARNRSLCKRMSSRARYCLSASWCNLFGSTRQCTRRDLF